MTGSELVGLIPKQALIDAGKYFLRKQKRSVGVSEEEIIKIAIKSLGRYFVEASLRGRDRHGLTNASALCGNRAERLVSI